MRNRFHYRLIELISAKGQNTQIFTGTVYLEMIQEVKKFKNKQKKKTSADVAVMTIREVEKFVPVKEDNAIKYYVHTEEIFEVSHDAIFIFPLDTVVETEWRRK
ncbi:hypothetical protein ILUMI_21639 [Ignelater luminosus]|uniref:Uncharacterized protein n=1 Tax=Ignelater luminosus TaxID=2038154 RepID=A0A8K0CHB0_IGNLU|nr:hypothetical protein ILUMI_21639 [Ignelater luminosus]